MEKTWASGALELLRHADSHIDLDSAFDKRVAFISIDNCVEVCIRTFLSLPLSKSNVKVPRAEIEAAGNSFPKLLGLLFTHTPDRFSGLDADDIEHYHRIRNTLYHDGTGLSVDEQYLKAYRSIAEILLQNLFGVTPGKPIESQSTLEVLVHNWNHIDKLVKETLERAGLTTTFRWEEAFTQGLLKPEEIKELTELRMARNRLVHSETIDRDEIAFWTKKSERLLQALLQRLRENRG
jgi:hypothetical protein